MATLAELQTVLGDPALKDKIRAAVTVAAVAVSFEDSGTANHTNRLKWAKAALNDPNGTADKVTRYVVAANAAQTLATIQGLSDTDIQNHTNASINIFADGS